MTLYLVTFSDQSASCVAKMYVRITTGYARSLIQPLSPIHEHLLCLSVSFVCKGKEVKSVYEPNGSTGRGSTKGLRVFLFRMLVHRRITLQHSCTCIERDTVRVQCYAQKQNAISAKARPQLLNSETSVQLRDRRTCAPPRCLKN